MRLQLCTWKEVEEYIKKSPGIIVPIGSTEQHGPNGLLGTDAFNAEKIAHLVSEEYDVLVAPTLNIGMAQHHMAFPGTLSLSPSTMISMICDIVTSLSRHGFSHIFFVNGHGGNIASLNVAFSELYSRHCYGQQNSDLRCTFVNWYSGKRVEKLSKSLFGESEGQHATPSEVALSYYIYPDHVKKVEMTPNIAPDGTITDALDFRRQFPDGRMGSNPSLASVELGKRICDAAFQDVCEAYQLFVSR